MPSWAAHNSRPKTLRCAITLGIWGAYGAQSSFPGRTREGDGPCRPIVHGPYLTYQWRVLRRAVRERFDARIMSYLWRQRERRFATSSTRRSKNHPVADRSGPLAIAASSRACQAPRRTRQIRRAAVERVPTEPVPPESDVAEESASLSNDAADPVDTATLDVDDWDVAC